MDIRGLVLVFVFFNCPSTTGIYTYLHTRSLHDALPIWEAPFGDGLGRRRDLLGAAADDGDLGARPREVLRNAEIDPAGCARNEGRSEEHTSELQSLMRISYAVFCLKKKKK